MSPIQKQRGHKRRVIARLTALCLAVAAVIALGFIEIPTHQRASKALIEATIGREFGPMSSLSGDITFHVLPRPALSINNVAIDLESGLSVRATRIIFDLALAPLVHATATPVAIGLDEPQISLPRERVPADFTEFNEKALTLGLRLGLARSAPVTDAISEFRISGGSVTFTDPVAPLDGPLALNGTLTTASDGSAHGSTSGQWRGRDFSADFSLGTWTSGGEPRARPVSLHLALGKSNLSVKGTLNDSQPVSIDGGFSSTIDDLDHVITWVGGQPSGASAPPLTLDGTAHITHSALSLAPAQIRLGPVAMNGSLTVDVGGKRPLIGGTLSAGDMDLTGWLTPLWPKAKDSSGWKLEKLPESLALHQDLDIRLSAERVNLGIVRVADTAVTIFAKDGSLDIGVGSTHLFQGKAKGKLTVTPTYSGYNLQSRGSFEGIDLGQLTLAVLDIKRVEGIASGKFDLESSGASADDVMHMISGHAEGKIASGSLTGVNLANLLRRIETRPLSVIRDMRGGRTDFDAMTASFTLSRGKATLDANEMAFPPNTMKLGGAIDIGNRSLDLTGEATGPTPQNGSEPATLAFTVTGDFDDPIVTPDINRILKRNSGSTQTTE